MQLNRLKIILVAVMLSTFCWFGHSFAADPVTDWYGVIEGDPDHTYLVVGIYPDGDAAYDALLTYCPDPFNYSIDSPWIYTIWTPLVWRWPYNGVICACGEEHVYSGDNKWAYALVFLHPDDGILPEQTEPILDFKSRGN